MSAALRPATAADAAALAALHETGFEEHWSAGGMAGLLAMPGTFALIAEAEGTVCGFVLTRVAADEAEILSIAVHPAFRRRSLGRALLLAAAERALAEGALVVHLEVAVDNPAALGLYAGLGFRQSGRRRGYYARAQGPAADALILNAVLPLAAGGGSG